jgi:uncharacterized protein involved in exopolysaccharide biosynthesis
MAIFQRNGRLEETMTNLLQSQANLLQAQAALAQNQAAFLSHVQALDRELAELKRENAERFARIEAILLRHEQLLQALPEAIREKIGSKAPGT